MSNPKLLACVLASGSGTRFGAFPPKQFQLLKGKPLYLYVVETLVASNLFAEIEIMIKPEFVDDVKRDVANVSKAKPTNITVSFGSDARVENINHFFAHRAKALPGESILAIFDANRPFVPLELLVELNKSCIEHGATCPARPVVDGCCYVDAGEILNIPPKDNLYSLQTPEFIRLDFYKKCLSELPAGAKYYGIAELVRSSGNPMSFVRSDERCFKVTEPRDWVYAEFLVENKML